MQTRDMYRSPQWKMVASVAALSALGVGGLALADTPGTENPPAITLSDSQAITTAPLTTITTNLGFGTLSAFDSPFELNDTGDGEAEGDDDDADDQEDSPAESTAPTEDPESPDTPDESPEG